MYHITRTATKPVMNRCKTIGLKAKLSLSIPLLPDDKACICDPLLHSSSFVFEDKMKASQIPGMHKKNWFIGSVFIETLLTLEPKVIYIPWECCTFRRAFAFGFRLHKKRERFSKMLASKTSKLLCATKTWDSRVKDFRTYIFSDSKAFSLLLRLLVLSFCVLLVLLLLCSLLMAHISTFSPEIYNRFKR